MINIEILPNDDILNRFYKYINKYINIFLKKYLMYNIIMSNNNVNINNSINGKNMNLDQYYRASIGGEIKQQVSYNDDSRWNCVLSQPQPIYTFNVAAGYIAGQPTVQNFVVYIHDFEKEANPLDIINRKK